MLKKSVVTMGGIVVLIISTGMFLGMKVKKEPHSSNVRLPKSISIPSEINYQGYLISGGSTVNDTVNIIFSIWDAQTGGNQKWSETQNGVVVNRGIFSVVLGSVSPIPDTVFNGVDRWLQIEIDGQVFSGRTRITSVAYAFRAHKSDTADYAVSSPLTRPITPPVSSNEISDTSITNAKLGSNAITTDKIQDGTIINADISASAGITDTKLSGTGTLITNFNADMLDGQHASAFLTGSGTVGRSARWTAATTLGNSAIYDNGSDIAVGTSVQSGKRIYGYYSSNNYGYIGADGVGVSGVGLNEGVYGSSPNGDFYGVIGSNWYSAGAVGICTGAGVGVYGSSSSSDGVKGLSSAANGVRGEYTGTTIGGGIGVYGVGGKGTGVQGVSSDYYGVVGLVSNNTYPAVYGRNNNNNAAGALGYLDRGVYGTQASGNFAGYFDGDVYIKGNYTATGTKSATVPTSKGNVLLYSQESPENWFEDFGEGQLINGRAHIDLDPLFLETVTINEKCPMKVFIQLRDNCKGTYVKTGKTGFDVFEVENGKSNAHFSYRVVAKRKGYENKRFEEVNDLTKKDINWNEQRNIARVSE